MNTGPYSSEVVQKYIEEQFIPVKSECFWDKRTDLMKRFAVKWTPTLLVLDAEGEEHHRVVGYVPNDDFLAHLELGLGKIAFDRDRYAEARTISSGHRPVPGGGSDPGGGLPARCGRLLEDP
jgi:hypothetical protein